jgi:hypothetical protein
MLELKIQNVESDVSSVKDMVTEVHGMMQKMAAKQIDRLSSWGIGIFGFLIGSVGWLISQYILK